MPLWTIAHDGERHCVLGPHGVTQAMLLGPVTVQQANARLFLLAHDLRNVLDDLLAEARCCRHDLPQPLLDRAAHLLDEVRDGELRLADSNKEVA